MGCVLEEWGTPGAIKGAMLMGSHVVRKFVRAYQMNIMSGQRSSCSLNTKCGTGISEYCDLYDFIYLLFHKIECLLCSP